MRFVLVRVLSVIVVDAMVLRAVGVRFTLSVPVGRDEETQRSEQDGDEGQSAAHGRGSH